MLEILRNKLAKKSPEEKLQILIEALMINEKESLKSVIIDKEAADLFNLNITSDVYEIFTEKGSPLMLLFIKNQEHIHVAFNASLVNKASIFLYKDLCNLLPNLQLEHDYYRDKLGAYYFDGDADLAMLYDIEDDIVNEMRVGQEQIQRMNKEVEEAPVTCIIPYAYYSPRNKTEAMEVYKNNKDKNIMDRNKNNIIFPDSNNNIE